MIFYILAGLSIGFYITIASVYSTILKARKDGIENTFTNNLLLATILNTVFLTIIWPVVTPYFFSTTFREALNRGFTSAICAED